MGDSESRAASDPDAVQLHKPSTASQIRPKGPVPFGKYELLQRLRVGGMAELFRARELDEAARVVALKRILPSFTDEADYVAMFIDEARLALRLKHPGIVEAFELGQIEDELYIALEYVHGQDAATLLRRARELQQPLPPGVACAIAIAVCDALEYAHELRDEHGARLGIVHRDVSPQNVLVSYQGDVKLIDFGIAKSNEQLMRTQAGLLKGKHGYLSPEQAQGVSVDRRSDVFSLGVCLYEMLSARRLFQGSSDFSTIVRVRKTEVPSLLTLNRDLPQELAAIVARTLAQTPSERFSTARALAAALRDFAASHDLACDRAAVASYLQATLPEGSTGAQLESGGGAERDPTTGLLAAFDDIEPPSAVSVLAKLEQQAPANVPAHVAAVPVTEAIEDQDLLQPAFQSSADAAAQPSDFSPRHERDRDDEPTRVVEYESTLEGQLAQGSSRSNRYASRSAVARETRDARAGDSAAANEAPSEITRPKGRRPSAPVRAELPGSALEWDDEELSTRVYDGPASEQAPLPSALADVLPAAPAPRSVATLRPIANRKPTPFGTPAPTLGTFPRPPRMPSLQYLGRGSFPFGAVIAAALVVAIAATLWLMRSPATATLQLTTTPGDAIVTLDGVTVSGGMSPFVITGIKTDLNHEIEVRHPGYRAWHTRLIFLPGQTLKLPHVALMQAAPQPVQTQAASSDGRAPPPVALQPVRLTGPSNAQSPQQDPAPQPVQRPRRLTQARDMPKAKGAVAATRRPIAPVPTKAVRPNVVKTAQAGGTGTLRINSRPWSRVYVDGRLIGDTPQTGIVLGAGRHTVTLVNAQFDLRKVLTVELKPGQTVTKVIALSE